VSAVPVLDVRAVTVTVRGAAGPLVDQVSLAVPAGTTVGLLGPNGSGKSTLLRTVHRVTRPASGSVLVEGEDVVSGLPRAELARRVAVLEQDPPLDFDLQALDVVRTGRLPHRATVRESPAALDARALGALRAVGIDHRADAHLSELSGGERQRVLLARALVQTETLLLLDEPGNHLDLRAQLELLDLLRDFGGSVVAVFHDLNLAAAVCDVVCVLDGGRVRACGPTAEVLTPALISEVFGVPALVDVNPLTGRPRVTLGALLDHAEPTTRGATAGAGPSATATSSPCPPPSVATAPPDPDRAPPSGVLGPPSAEATPRGAHRPPSDEAAPSGARPTPTPEELPCP
jgi:iron complex transport system ATP-binding protein